MAREIDIDQNGGDVQVVVTIGDANTGAFAVHLFEADRTTQRQLAQGTARNGAGLPIPVDAAASLPNKFLTWDAVVVPVTGTRFSVTLTVLQDGQHVTSFTDFGDLNAGDNVGVLRTGAKFV